MLTQLRKYIDLQKRAQEAEFQVRQLLTDNDTLGQLVAHYKRKAERLEYEANHPRKSGQFVRKIPITVVEFTK